MSKSKKNTVDPENIINHYGADSVRLFILSDSPPEKDVQWSEEGIIASFKFIQKLWGLNNKIKEEIDKNYKKDISTELTKYTNKFIKKISDNLEHFHYNIIVANLHEMHSFINKEISKGYQKRTILENYEKMFSRKTYIKMIWATATYVLIVVPFSVVIGLCAAMLLNSLRFGRVRKGLV